MKQQSKAGGRGGAGGNLYQYSTFGQQIRASQKCQPHALTLTGQIKSESPSTKQARLHSESALVFGMEDRNQGRNLQLYRQQSMNPNQVKRAGMIVRQHSTSLAARSARDSRINSASSQREFGHIRANGNRQRSQREKSVLSNQSCGNWNHVANHRIYSSEIRLMDLSKQYNVSHLEKPILPPSRSSRSNASHHDDQAPQQLQ